MTGETVRLKRGGVHIGCDLYERYFAGLESLVLLRRKDDLLILPVRHAAAGGYLLKLRNVAGDRVVNAPDFFREHGIDDDIERDLDVAWAPEAAALVATGLFRLQS